MAVLVLAQPIADDGEYGPGSGAGVRVGQPGPLAQLFDEVVDLDRPRLLLRAPCFKHALGQIGKIQGEPPRLALAQLIRQALKYRPADISRFLTRQPGSLRHRTGKFPLVHGHGPLPWSYRQVSCAAGSGQLLGVTSAACRVAIAP
ncbi:MAG TPA: hypothetical protein VMA72_05400 [Streptosporangiaceae bacterium]|nr:hypothetical protein [Streptosporangiaceae bacterium]